MSTIVSGTSLFLRYSPQSMHSTSSHATSWQATSFPTFTVFDLETTGLDPQRGERIIEIAGVRIVDGHIDEENHFVQLVNPERSIPWEAKRVHKITDEQVANAPTIDMVLPKFLDFAKDSVLVAHNAQFDMGFLESEKQCCWGYVELPECICTMRLSRLIFPTEFRHNLDALSHRLGLQIPTMRHRALPDVLLTGQALLQMIEMGNIGSMDDLRIKAGNKQIVA
jgi:DNA polymerase III subunit epsilon